MESFDSPNTVSEVVMIGGFIAAVWGVFIAVIVLGCACEEDEDL